MLNSPQFMQQMSLMTNPAIVDQRIDFLAASLTWEDGWQEILWS